MSLTLCGMVEWNDLENAACNTIWHKKGVIHICTDDTHPDVFEHECECGESK